MRFFRREERSGIKSTCLGCGEVWWDDAERRHTCDAVAKAKAEAELLRKGWRKMPNGMFAPPPDDPFMGREVPDAVRAAFEIARLRRRAFAAWFAESFPDGRMGSGDG